MLRNPFARRLGVLEELAYARPLLSRRKMLLGGALAALWAETPARAAPSQSNLRFLLSRITYGHTPAEFALAQTLGYHGYLEYQLNYQAIDDSACNARLAAYHTINQTSQQMMDQQIWFIIPPLIEAIIIRAVYSKRQLYERMVEFWTDHFTIDILKGIVPWLKTTDDREVIRAHALGRFPDLLLASMQSPAMLVYLDNASSMMGNANENYARELLELHTLGVDGGYTQQDVVEVSRCLTGWSLEWEPNSLNYLKFRFYPNAHDDGPKTVLGHAIPAGGGINDGLMVRDILVNHPSTAKFLAKKLCRRFWREDPPQALVDAVAAAYTATGGDITAMVRALFTTLDPSTAGPKYRRPFHYTAAALRATGAEIQPLVAPELQEYLALAGHLPFHWSPPDGYPDRLDWWANLILPRWNIAAAVLDGLVPGTTVDINAFTGGATSAQAIADRIDSALFGGVMNTADKNRIIQYLLPDPPPGLRIREAVALALSSPGFQWY